MNRPRAYNDVFITVRLDVDNIDILKEGVPCSKVTFVPVEKSEHIPYLFGVKIDDGTITAPVAGEFA